MIEKNPTFPDGLSFRGWYLLSLFASCFSSCLNGEIKAEKISCVSF